MDLLRNAQDLFANPQQYVEMVVDRLKNFNRGEKAVINNQGAGMVPMTTEERVGQFTQGALDNLGGGGMGALGVIKNKGGNWLSGRFGPEDQLRQLRKYGDPGEIAKYEEYLAAPVDAVPPNLGIQATPEARARWQNDLTMLRQGQALNQFVEGPLTKYVKNDMAAPSDPIRLLADAWPAEKAKKLAVAEARVKALRTKQEAQAATRGVPEEYLTRTRQDVLAAEEARDIIEANTGIHIPVNNETPGFADYVRNVREAKGFPAEGMAKTPMGQQWELQTDREILQRPAKDFLVSENLKQDPWLAKVDPNALVNNLTYGAGNLKHITDELYNSLREGRLTPEQVARMPVDQAVRHVAEINALRAVKSRQEQALEAAGIPLHKDYPEQGMSWRQLKLPSDPADWQRQFNARRDELTAGNRKWAYDALNKKIEAELGPRPIEQLKKWLTQEGDAMGHCVGGYCDDVVEGSSSIYSLRDAKGQPYVTIETTPGTEAASMSNVQNIAQIKGPGNRAPAAEHLPFIQDFIRSGQWNDIQDAAHTGLTKEEINALLKR